MASFKFLALISVILAFILVSSSSRARKIEILDKNGDASNIESIAQAVCDTKKGTGRQISHPSTIHKLVEFFQSIGHDHRLANCAHQYLPAFEQMQLILTSGNEDVCGESKISLIEKFHRNFVSRIRKYKKEQKANHMAAPKILKLFYMHYASAISATCAQSATEELESIEFKTKSETNTPMEPQQETEQILNLIGKISPSHGYKDMFLVWNFIDSLPLEKDVKMSRYLHEGKTRLVLKASKAENLVKVQESCSSKLKPFYSLSLLAVIRLADLGFYPEDETLVGLINSNEHYSSLYKMTQLCETVLPLYVVQDESLESGHIVILSKDETKSMSSTAEDTFEETTIPRDTSRIESLASSITSDQSLKFIKRVKANVRSRVSAQNHILSEIIIKFKKGSKLSNAGHMTLSEESDSGQDLHSLIQESLPKIDESNPLKPLENDEEEEEVPHKLLRKRRGVVTKIVQSIVGIFVVTIAAVIYLALWIIIWLIKIFIIGPFILGCLIIELITDITVGLWATRVMKYKLPKFPAMLSQAFFHGG